MTRTKLDTPAFADSSVDTRTIKDGTIIAQDVSGSITNAKLANSSISVNGSSVSLGGSSSITVHLEWQAVTVADGSTVLTAEAGKGYFLDTNAGVIEVKLPASPTRGDTIALVDYAGHFDLNRIEINTQGQSIDSSETDGSSVGGQFRIDTKDAIVELIYVDAVKGWMVMLNQTAGSTPSGVMNDQGGYDTIPPFISATGGTITTTGDFKVHTFTGDGCFVVSSTPGSAKVSYLVVAGGGGAGSVRGGGGGAGGYREGKCTSDPYSASPLNAPDGLTVTATTFPVTVGAGGAGTDTQPQKGSSGSNSIFSTITSAGGGGGGSGLPSSQPVAIGVNGGSGGGGAGSADHGGGTGGTGNTPPVSPPQGQNGGAGSTSSTVEGAGGGGGAEAAGQNGSGSSGGNGGDGVSSSINGSSTARAGGGGGGAQGSGGDGGAGGGANSGCNAAGSNASDNLGGGGSGAGTSSCSGGNGGKGVVVIRYKFQ